MDEIVGQLNFTGDIRATGGREIMYSPRHGAVKPVLAQYDQDLDRTTISYGPVDERTEVAPGEESLSLAAELLRRRRERSAAWARAMGDGIHG